jgi:membrane protein required for colicin V production
MGNSMAEVDWAIVILILLSALRGLRQGFFRVVCSLGGLFLGLVLAAWNYSFVAALILPMARSEAVADTIGFLVIAFLVMTAAGILGNMLAQTLHTMGLGCLDKLAGVFVGFLQGVLLVTLFILVAVAFFPQAHWLVEARLPRMFFGACHLSTHMSPADLAERVRDSLKMLEQESPWWLHPGGGQS